MITFKQGYKEGRGVFKDYIRWLDGDPENGPRMNVDPMPAPPISVMVEEWNCTEAFARGFRSGLMLV